MELSRKFIWVLVDRDKSPGLPEKFNVSSYPSLITLGAKQEKIHRFSGFRKADQFRKDLEDALRRHALYLKGEEWDTPEPRPEKICDQGRITTFKAPSAAVPEGLAVADDHLWVVQEQKLHQLDKVTGRVKATHPLEKPVTALCFDGAMLYALPYGWTAGEAIQVLDPADAKVKREIVTEENKKNKSHGARGIAWRDGRLQILAGMEGIVYALDPKTGEVESKVQVAERWLTGLAFDGAHYVTASRTHLLKIDPRNGEVEEKTPLNYQVRSLAIDRDAVFLMEQPVFGHGKDHKPVQIWPKETLIYRLEPEEKK